MEHIHNYYTQDSWTHIYTRTALLKMQSEMVAPEYTSIQEEEKKRFPSLPACTPPTTRQKQRPSRQVQPTPSTALTPPAGLSSFQMHCLQIGIDKDPNDLSSTLTSFCRAHTVVLQWIPPPHCNVTYRLWQRKAQQKSRRTGQ